MWYANTFFYSVSCLFILLMYRSHVKCANQIKKKKIESQPKFCRQLIRLLLWLQCWFHGHLQTSKLIKMWSLLCCFLNPLYIKCSLHSTSCPNNSSWIFQLWDYWCHFHLENIFINYTHHQIFSLYFQIKSVLPIFSLDLTSIKINILQLVCIDHLFLLNQNKSFSPLPTLCCFGLSFTISTGPGQFHYGSVYIVDFSQQ